MYEFTGGKLYIGHLMERELPEIKKPHISLVPHHKGTLYGNADALHEKQ